MQGAKASARFALGVRLLRRLHGIVAIGNEAIYQGVYFLPTIAKSLHNLSGTQGALSQASGDFAGAQLV
jgi:hypothetical protein